MNRASARPSRKSYTWKWITLRFHTMRKRIPCGWATGSPLPLNGTSPRVSSQSFSTLMASFQRQSLYPAPSSLLAPHLNGDIPCTEEDSSRAWHEGLEQQFLEISYEDKSDTLWLGNGKPGSTGHDICYGVFIAFFDSTDRTPIGVMLDSAAELLRPHLPLEKAEAVSTRPSPT